MRSQLKKIEDLGAAMEEALILDNKYTEHSTVGLAQQWDQLDQLGMRMQHNLEQQIQARWAHGGHAHAQMEAQTDIRIHKRIHRPREETHRDTSVHAQKGMHAHTLYLLYNKIQGIKC